MSPNSERSFFIESMSSRAALYNYIFYIIANCKSYCYFLILKVLPLNVHWCCLFMLCLTETMAYLYTLECFNVIFWNSMCNRVTLHTTYYNYW